jgi:hypothetical protein
MILKHKVSFSFPYTILYIVLSAMVMIHDINNQQSAYRQIIYTAVLWIRMIFDRIRCPYPTLDPDPALYKFFTNFFQHEIFNTKAF